MTPLIDDGYYDEPVPGHEPDPPRRGGCSVSVLPWLVLVLLLAAPSGAGHAIPAADGSRAVSPFEEPVSGNLGRLRGAPHVAPGPPSPAAGGTLAVPEPIGSVAAPTGEVGTAAYSATATWCAPRGDQCQGWGGDARLGALPGFRWGDQPYWVRVWHGERHVDVKVVSYCDCPGNIDLSSAAFRVLAPQSRGRIDVVIEDLRGVADAPLPATDTGGMP